jgi:predicted AlkP superfamily phosphohydrolase/phosphomutase
MTAFPPKVLYIGLDAAAPDVVLRGCRDGFLPRLRALQADSGTARTRNSPAVYTGSLWPTVWTGTGPGRHGCYYNEQLEPGTYELAEFIGHDVLQEPFWNALSRAGRRVALFDVPKTPLCPTINGLQIADWGTHDAEMLPCSTPPELILEFHAKYGPAGFRRCDWVMDGPNPEETLRRELLQRIETRLAIARDLMQREAWDLFMVGFGESHCVGHQCWHLHDATHPGHDPALLARIGDPVQDVYVALDRAVGELLAHTGPDTVVMVHCSHGMAAHYDGTHLLDRVLRRLEGRPAPATRTLLDHTRNLWKQLPLRFTERFGDLARRVNRMPDASDRATRACFVVPTNANSAGIRLNLAGREPSGQIQPGAEAEAFVSRLCADLMELIDPVDGRPLVKEIVHSRKAFPGEQSSRLPDLFVRWNRNQPITRMASPKIGIITGEDHSTHRTGDHRPGGLLFLRGPGISERTVPGEVRDEDIAPTLAALLGVELEGVDGRSIWSRQSRPDAA